MFSADGTPRPTARALVEVLARLGPGRPDRHVKIGHGRFYADVPPVKGLYLGGAESHLSSRVTMTRLDPQAGARA